MSVVNGPQPMAEEHKCPCECLARARGHVDGSDASGATGQSALRCYKGSIFLFRSTFSSRSVGRAPRSRVVCASRYQGASM